MRKCPKLCVHTTGVYFVKHRGKNHYFFKDPEISTQAYVRWVAEVWAPSQKSKAAGASSEELSVLELAEYYLNYVHQRSDLRLFRSYRSYLRPLVSRVGHEDAIQVQVETLEDLRDALLLEGYLPRTINHTLKAIQRMYRWGEKRRLLSAPSLDHLEMVPVPRPQPKDISLKDVQVMLEMTEARDARLTPWLAMCYLCCARPSEIVRLANNQGRWHSTGVYRMQSKVGSKTGYDRFLLINLEAQQDWLPRLAPHWQTQSGFSESVRRTCNFGGPRQLRSAGATHLRRSGVSYPDVRAALGHFDMQTLVHYVNEDFSTVLPFMERLSLRRTGAATGLGG